MKRNEVDRFIVEICRNVDLPCGLSKMLYRNALVLAFDNVFATANWLERRPHCNMDDFEVSLM